MKLRWNDWLAGALICTGLLATTPGRCAETPALTDSQREAAALFKGMTDYLAGLQSFSVKFRAGYDVVQATGQKIEFGETRSVVLARPDRLRVEEVASDGKRDLALFDGHDITVFDADAAVFAKAPQPGTVDDALVYFVRELRMRMPLALLLTTRLPDALPSRVQSIDYVESTEILGVPTDHIAGRAENVDFQFWITQGSAPAAVAGRHYLPAVARTAAVLGQLRGLEHQPEDREDHVRVLAAAGCAADSLCRAGNEGSRDSAAT